MTVKSLFLILWMTGSRQCLKTEENLIFHSLFLQSVHYLVNVILYIESSDQSMGQAIIVNAILGNILADFIGNFF